MAKDAPSSLVFACGARAYAVPSEQAFEVVTFGELTRVPGAAPHVRGLLAHRGEVVPIIDLGVLRDGEPANTERAVVVRSGRDVLALTLTEVDGILPLEASAPAAGDVGFLSLLQGPLPTAEREYVFRLDVGRLIQWLHESGGRPAP